MSSPPLDALAGRTAVLATMHGKEAAIGPVLARFTGLYVVVPEHFDSDRFGTFSRGRFFSGGFSRLAGAERKNKYQHHAQHDKSFFHHFLHNQYFSGGQHTIVSQRCHISVTEVFQHVFFLSWAPSL